MIKLTKNNLRAILRVVIFAAATVAVISILPHEGKFKFEFQKGRPWSHETLIAPFDFPIYKSDARLLEEKSAVLKSFKPYFDFDSTTVNGVVAQASRGVADYLTRKQQQQNFPFRFSTLRNPNLSMVKQEESVSNLMTECFRFVYGKGVVSLSDANQFFDGTSNDVPVVVLHNDFAYETISGELFTPKMAMEYLVNKLASSFFRTEDQALAFARDAGLERVIVPNVKFDKDKTSKVKAELLGSVSLTSGMVQSGERIVAKGDIVDANTFMVLESLKHEYESRLGFSGQEYILLLGHSFLVGICMLILYLFLFHFRRDILQSVRKILFIILLVVTMVAISAWVMSTSTVSIYLIPFVVVPIFVRTFYDSRLALFIHLITIMLVGFQAPNSFEFIFINFVAGVVAIFSLTNAYRRGKLFVATGYVFLVYASIFFALNLLKEGNFSNIVWFDYVWFLGNAFLILVTYQLVYVFEKVFGFLSDTTLMELSDHNQELLRRLAEEAPGTFQHSLQVSTLAEAAVFQIGGNPLLVKIGGLYHDIGKLNNPIYFIENQVSEFNPHHNIEFEESAKIIVKHVADGVQIARKYKLPEQIIDFIRTHHGSSKVQYFYRLYRSKFPEGGLDDSFCYPGPRPMSKETAVLMMADAVEAASRSLSNVTAESIDELVESIVNFQQQEDQFAEADITFKDITTIKTVFKKKLLNIYHVRVVYPQ
ncbi:MAG TPA: HDIG domain-containing protein [Williamwhitmania sp.]|nr:HDIG domain-containing protein [Williamwhitmania sp.]